ncbi:MAG TPA: nickel pincer cofactor biosynthesis protein LarB [Roseiflexaceae bacterium]|nr:nickel pincer cofactor biosynthesis protein LarB [Roseiflexaceae bacterium]
MDEQALRALLGDVQQGQMNVDEALNVLRRLPFDDMGFAKLDSHRALRNGFPEVVLCTGKRTEHIVAIVERLASGTQPVIATRATPEVAAAVQRAVPNVRYNEVARMLIHEPQPLPKRQGTIIVITAGTADVPVAEEAAMTADIMGNHVDRLFDVGVAGLHRLLAHVDRVMAASVVIVAAGMEGALPSVVGGLVRRPLIAVPTSVGYGASFGGIAALLGMLNSCASGITVVNIDNGFGAGFAASLMNALGERA